VDRRDLGGVDAQLRAEAVPTGPGEVRDQAGLVAELGCDPADRRGDPRASGGHSQSACGVGQPVGGVLDLEVEVERVVQGAEDEPDDPGGRGDLLGRRKAARAFHQREDDHVRRGGPHGRDVVGRLGLGQHDRGDPGLGHGGEVTCGVG
jgi:hypothetical protein